ncbi:protein translocase subunit SecF [Dictyobacter aurantiacus]|uniref:Protein-export membrane protein SecF n=1 Tax=Dictyobacter aurantiacus TaxID=1936993 RepID=A0A401ZAJ9_9CHLR|nr:protein translocase subunit SecF [Dictyobacter aurantiacus]GCE03897.1 hypothetical protein KDAU_12260 [Dictyobacter aurantiacus]
MLNLVKYRKLFLLISLIVIIPGTISLLIFGLNVGIDFAGGTNITLRPQHTIADADTVRNLLAPFKLESEQIVLGKDTKGATNAAWIRFDGQVDKSVTDNVQKTLDKKYNQALGYDTATMSGSKPYTLVTVTKFTSTPKADDIKAALSNLSTTSSTPTVGSATPTATPTASAKSTPTATNTQNGSATTTPVKIADVQTGDSAQTINILTKTSISPVSSVTPAAIQSAFLQHGGPYFMVQSNAQVGPSVAGRTVTMAILAVIAASLLILLYVWFSFRKVPKALRYGVCAIVALLHDALVVLGIFSILGKFFGMQIDSLFITALLTVIGFSVHDTIVVFDRVRENMQRRTVETFEEVVNASLVQTLARSLNTSLTVLFTLLTLTLFTGIGTDIHTFTLALLIGIFSGTYSSIFNASMMLVIWEKGELGMKYLQGKRDEKPYARKRDREVRELAETRS